jgi:putative PIN family toxin of toxin-antitoxin system
MLVVVDTNVIVSGLISPRGAPGEVLRLWHEGRFTWVTSRALLNELARALRYPKVSRRLPDAIARAAELTSHVEATGHVVEPTRPLDVIESDPADNRVLEAAVEGEADCVVTGDNDLLKLGEFEGISIITPARFVAIVSSNL